MVIYSTGREAEDMENVYAALQHLNWSYGRGDVQRVNFVRRVVFCKLQYGTRAYKFDIIRLNRGGLSVRMHGHQKRI